MCFRPKTEHANFLTLFADEDPLCADCRSKLTKLRRQTDIGGLQCEVLYLYDKNFASVLLQYKELCDEALYPVFLYPFLSSLKWKYRNYVLLAVPSTAQKREQRGFDHVEKAFSLLNLCCLSPFEKEGKSQQKKASYLQRWEIGEHIRLKEDAVVPDKPLLLVDDVLTTGASLSACYGLIRNHSHPVKALVLSAGSRILEERSLSGRKGKMV